MGVNYIQIDPETHYHSLISKFHRDRVAQAFRQIATENLDTVRIFVEVEAYPNRGEGLSGNDQIVKNLYELLRLAEDSGLRLIVTFDHWIPRSYLRHYAARSREEKARRKREGWNAYILDPQLVAAHAQSIADLLGAVVESAKQQSRSVRSLFAVDIANGLSFYINHAPFPGYQGDHGTPSTAINDQARLGLERVKQGVGRYLRAHREALRAAGYDGRVTFSAFSPAQIPRRNRVSYLIPDTSGGPVFRWRRPIPLPFLERNPNLDFFSLHLYPDPRDPDRSVDALLKGFGICDSGGSCGVKPALVTEIGEITNFFAKLDSKASYEYLTNALHSLCQHGVAGWLYWDWATRGQTIPMLKEKRLLSDLRHNPGRFRC